MRDYLYIPLGGNRVAAWRVYVNLFIVFFLCGLWHGAKWTFVVWGLIHGLFMVLERIGLMRRITGLPVIRHVYALSVICFAWVFFRADSFPYALGFFETLVRASPAAALTLRAAVSNEAWTVFFLGCFFATPLASSTIETMLQARRGTAVAAAFVQAAVLVLFVASVAKVAAGSYSPFIYFRF
jgi:alginate O-acetyltransferase complex protein AlgI